MMPPMPRQRMELALRNNWGAPFDLDTLFVRESAVVEQ